MNERMSVNEAWGGGGGGGGIYAKTPPSSWLSEIQ